MTSKETLVEALARIQEFAPTVVVIAAAAYPTQAEITESSAEYAQLALLVGEAMMSLVLGDQHVARLIDETLNRQESSHFEPDFGPLMLPEFTDLAQQYGHTDPSGVYIALRQDETGEYQLYLKMGTSGVKGSDQATYIRELTKRAFPSTESAAWEFYQQPDHVSENYGDANDILELTSTTTYESVGGYKLLQPQDFAARPGLLEAFAIPTARRFEELASLRLEDSVRSSIVERTSILRLIAKGIITGTIPIPPSQT